MAEWGLWKTREGRENLTYAAGVARAASTNAGPEDLAGADWMETETRFAW